MKQIPRPGSRGDEGAPYQAQKYSPLTEYSLSAHFGQHLTYHQDAEPAFDLNQFCHADTDYESRTNTTDPASCAVPGDGADSSRIVSQPPQEYPPPPNDDLFSRGIENKAEASSSHCAIQPHMFPYSYNSKLPHLSDMSGNSAHMPKSPYCARSLPRPTKNSGSNYRPYQRLFDSTEKASQYRKAATRFDRKSYRTPDTADTIAEVQRDRMHNVERIYNAMTRGDAARDNENSIAMKRWVKNAYYKPELVEAYAHKVLDCLLLQTTEGFRGWVGDICPQCCRWDRLLMFFF